MRGSQPFQILDTYTCTPEHLYASTPVRLYACSHVHFYKCTPVQTFTRTGVRFAKKSHTLNTSAYRKGWNAGQAAHLPSASRL